MLRVQRRRDLSRQKSIGGCGQSKCLSGVGGRACCGAGGSRGVLEQPVHLPAEFIPAAPTREVETLERVARPDDGAYEDKPAERTPGFPSHVLAWLRNVQAILSQSASKAKDPMSPWTPVGESASAVTRASRVASRSADLRCTEMSSAVGVGQGLKPALRPARTGSAGGSPQPPRKGVRLRAASPARSSVEASRGLGFEDAPAR